MSCTQDEEIESLKAIFYKDGEFIATKDTDGLHVTVNFDFSSLINRVKSYNIEGHGNGIDFVLATEYPVFHLPKISLRCSYLPASIVDAIKQQVRERASALQGQPMLLDLYSLAHELLEKEIDTFQTSVHKSDGSDTVSLSKESSAMMDKKIQTQTSNEDSSKKSDSIPNYSKDLTLLQKEMTHGMCDQNFDKCDSDIKIVTALLQLDHMRCKHKYVKLIKKWTAELSLTGRLVFCRKLILILLQGKLQAIRDYIVRNRTVNVDVDSKGRACKERMLTVLCEIPAETHTRFCEFSMEEIPTTESLQAYFQSFAMEDLYQDYVSHIY